MTRTEIERLAVVEEKLEAVSADVKALHQDLRNWMEHADNRYASKMTERIVYAAGASIGAVLVYSLMRVIGVRW